MTTGAASIGPACHLAPTTPPRRRPRQDRRMQPRHHARLQTAARLGLAHWFFGNLYEEVVRMPARIAEQPVAGGPLAAGSPVRYYLPAAPVTVATTLACVAAGWHRRA